MTTIGPLLDFDPTEALQHVFGARALSEVASLSREQRQLLHPALQPITAKAESLSALTLVQAGDAIERAKATVFERTAPFDIVLSPTMSEVNFPADQAAPDPARLYSILTYTAMFNQTGQPAAVVCGGFDERGLPIGLQLIGRRFEDLCVLQAAAFCEASRDFSWIGRDSRKFLFGDYQLALAFTYLPGAASPGG